MKMEPFDFLGAVDTWQGRQPPTVRLATVASLDAGGLRLVFDGEDEPTLKRYRFIGPYSPPIGARVACASVGSSWVVLGAIVAVPEDQETIPGNLEVQTLTTEEWASIGGDLTVGGDLALPSGGSQAAPKLALSEGFGLYGGSTFLALTAGGVHRLVAYSAGHVHLQGGDLRVGPNSTALHSTTTLDGMSYTGGFLTVSRNNTQQVMNQRTGSGTMVSYRQGGNEQGRVRIDGSLNVLFENVSDERTKRDIQPATIAEPLAKARAIQLVTYRHRTPEGAPPAAETLGTIAQQVAQIAPWAVGMGVDEEGNETTLGVDYGRLAALLHGPALDEMAGRVEELEDEVSELRAIVAALVQRLDEAEG